MATFHYHARRDAQIVTGQIVADTVAEAVTRLGAEGLAVEAIRIDSSTDMIWLGATTTPANAMRVASNTSSVADKAALVEPLKRVWSRCQPLLPALRAIVAELPVGMERRGWSQVLAALDQPYSDAVSRVLETHPELCLPLLRFVASDRDPVQALRECLDETRAIAELRRRRIRMFVYPAFIVTLCLTMFTALSIFVIPTFRTMFLDFDLRLPSGTHLLLRLAESFENASIVPLVAALMGLIGLLYWLAGKLPVTWRVWCGDRWGTPVGRATANARLASFLADLLGAGVDLPVALRWAGRAARSPRIERAAHRWAERVAAPTEHTSAGSAWPIPQSVCHAIANPVATSTRVRILRELSANFSAQSQFDIEWQRSLFEPLSILVIGLVVGATVLLLFWPLVVLVHALS